MDLASRIHTASTTHGRSRRSDHAADDIATFESDALDRSSKEASN